MSRSYSINTCLQCGANIQWQMTIEGIWTPLNMDGTTHLLTCPKEKPQRVQEQQDRQPCEKTGSAAR